MAIDMILITTLNSGDDWDKHDVSGWENHADYA